MKKNILIMLLISAILIFAGCKKEKRPDIITIPLVTWGGYASLFAANNGAEPNEGSLFWKYGKFKVKLVQIEDPSLQLSGFASGQYQIIWSTADMLPLLYDSLRKDPKTLPKLIGIFDYSKGGDGIISRGNIRSGKDLKGKKIVAAQYTPSHYFLLWYLNENLLSPRDVKMIYVEDAIVAKDTFIADKNIDVCVTWSPFVYDITNPAKSTYVPGSKLLMTSAKSPAYGTIADVYVARNDLVSKYPEMLYAFNKAMMEGYDIFNSDKKKVAQQIADLFGIKGGAEEVMKMFDDVTIAGKEESKKFFDPHYEYSAYKLIALSISLYKQEGKLSQEFKLNPIEVVDSRFTIKALQ
jgi:NitT/TauT family transport system substrate-binding protein